VGDSFVSGHPLSRQGGPQMLHPMFHTDAAQALSETHRLDGTDAAVVLPGHGPALRMPLADALAALRGPAPASRLGSRKAAWATPHIPAMKTCHRRIK